MVAQMLFDRDLRDIREQIFALVQKPVMDEKGAKAIQREIEKLQNRAAAIQHDFYMEV